MKLTSGQKQEIARLDSWLNGKHVKCDSIGFYRSFGEWPTESILTDKVPAELAFVKATSIGEKIPLCDIEDPQRFIDLFLTHRNTNITIKMWQDDWYGCMSSLEKIGFFTELCEQGLEYYARKAFPEMANFDYVSFSKL